MRTLATHRFLLHVLVAAVIFVSPADAQTISLQPIQLIGLKGVNVSTFADRALSGSSVLEKKLEARVVQLLEAGGVETSTKFNTWLAVEVEPVQDQRVLLDHTIIFIKVRLLEDVRLVRDSRVRMPGRNGAVTWSKEWIAVVANPELPQRVEEEVAFQVELFVSAVQAVNRR